MHPDKKVLENLDHAVRLSLLPGMTVARAASSAGVSATTLRKARGEGRVRITRDDLLLAALTENGGRTEGKIGDPAGLASWLDHINHDGTTADGIRRDLERLASEGWIALEKGRFRLLKPWP